jgi:hypothetical protein
VKTSPGREAAGEIAINEVQGVASADGVFLFSEEDNTIERARMGVTRSQRDKCIAWGDGVAEDLYASKSRDLVVGINEGATGDPVDAEVSFWGVSHHDAFGIDEPTEPKHDCGW